MKVLVVSFDKTLTDNLKKALEGHEVYVAKNSEEALKMIPSDVEGVIYDAISGAISEEDINTLYTKKFSNARYIILYDELFPVEEGNIIAPQKLLVPRDTDPSEVVKKLVEFPTEIPKEEAGSESEFEIEPTSLTDSEPQVEEVVEGTPDIEETIRELELQEQTVAEEPSQPAVEPVPVQETPTVSGEETGAKMILVISFDQTLVDTIRAIVGSEYEITDVKTVKQAIKLGKDASLIIFDAISGVIAEKGLVDMASDPDLSSKPYIILIDDLFPINVDNIPLKDKTAVSRDVDPSKIKEIIDEKLASTTATRPIAEETVPPQEERQETPVEEVVPEVPSMEIETPTEEVREEVEEEPTQEIEIESHIPQDIPEIEVEEVLPKEEEVEEISQQQEEEEIPALEALEKLMEAQREEEREVEEEPAVAVPPEVNLDQLVKEALSQSLSEDKVREAVLKAVKESLGDLKGTVEEIVRRELEKVFEDIDLKGIVKETAYKVLKEKLEKLIA